MPFDVIGGQKLRHVVDEMNPFMCVDTLTHISDREDIYIHVHKHTHMITADMAHYGWNTDTEHCSSL